MEEEISFIENINNIAKKLDVIVQSGELFNAGVIPILEDIATLDLYEAIQDLRKGNYLGNRKIDINLALNVQGIDQDLIDKNPDAAEAIWVDSSKTVLYDSATATFVDGTVIELPFIFDNNPATISTHADLLAQLSRLDYVTAIAQVDTIDTITAVNSTAYTVTINGTPFTYTSDIDATVAEIVTGLVTAINLGAEPVTALGVGGTSITLTADVAGTEFFAGVNANMVITTTTANRVAGPVETPFLEKLDHTLISSFASPVVGEIIRTYDVIGQNSNLERLELHVHSGPANDLNPVYFWAKTTSAFQTLSMRAGDIIKLGNDIDSIILLATSIQEVLEIQSRLPQLVDTFVNDVAQGDVTIYNKLTELDAIYQELTGLIAIYDDIKVGGTNYIQTVSTNIADVSTVATDLNLGATSNVARVGGSIDNVNATGGSIANVNTTATNIANVNLVATEIVPNLAEILEADENAAIATAQAEIATDKAVVATTQAGIATTKADTITAINGDQVAQTLSAGSSATAYYNSATGKFTFGIPQGIKGDRGDAFEVNAVGLFSARSLYDGQSIGFSFLAVDAGEIYFKLSNTAGDWSIAAPFGKGETGNGIANIAFTSTTGTAQGQPGETDTYTITYTDLTVTTFIVTNGLTINSIAFTRTTDVSGLAAQSGATDTYTITYSDLTTDNIQVYNGLNSAVLSVAGRTGNIVLTEADITDLDKYTQAQVDAALAEVGTIIQFEGALV